MAKYIIVISGLFLVVSATTAADFTLTGKLNGRLYYDLNEGDVDEGGGIVARNPYYYATPGSRNEAFRRIDKLLRRAKKSKGKKS